MSDLPIAPMPVLPIFMKLADRAVLLAGDGSASMAWKAGLIHASGGRVRVVASTPTPDLIEAVDRLKDRVEFIERVWSDDDLDDCAMAIGDFADRGSAERFVMACRSCCVPVNVIDKPDLCDFQFGALVNRAPLMVAISTDGAAPVLAQVVRGKIEALLPRALSEWTRRAGEFGRKMRSCLPEAKDRRVFWSRYAQAAFSRPVEAIEPTVAALRQGMRSCPAGRVSLVGAGPGDAELLTMKAAGTLRAADVILYDDLVGQEVLDLARREAQRIPVGKRGGVRRSCKQDDINAMMLALAQEGKHVVRLKSGDPTIFGRAGEEIELLGSAGIEVEVIPGVTAATAAAARLSASLTHRDRARGVKLITAHSRHGSLPELDWRAAADPETTLMIYMGAGTADQTSRALIAHGMSSDTPVIIATAVSLPEEHFSCTTLGGLQSIGIDRTHPVLICIGGVFADACQNISQAAVGN